MPVNYVGPPGSYGSVGENVPMVLEEVVDALQNSPVNVGSLVKGLTTQGHLPSNLPASGAAATYATQSYVTDYISGWTAAETSGGPTPEGTPDGPPSQAAFPSPTALTPGAEDFAFADFLPSSLLSSPGSIGSTGYVGIPALDSSGKLSPSNIPPLGIGYTSGPIQADVTITNPITAANNPLLFAQWNLGTVYFDFIPLVFINIFTSCNMSQPCVYVTLSESTTAPTSYNTSTNQQLIAMGTGRKYFVGLTSVAAQPLPDAVLMTPNPTNATSVVRTQFSYQTPFPAFITAWLVDLSGNPGATVQLSPENVISASLYMMRSSA